MTKLDEALDWAAETGSFELEDWPLVELPEQLSRLKNLNSITLKNTGLQDLPEWLSQLDELVIFRLTDDKIDRVPAGMHRLQWLRHLELSAPKIDTLPYTLSTLSNLEILVLRGCSLRSLPDSVSKLKSLFWLDLSSNKLRDDRDILFPPELKYLYLSENAFAAIPRSIFSLSNLRVLDLTAPGYSFGSRLAHEFPFAERAPMDIMSRPTNSSLRGMLSDLEEVAGSHFLPTSFGLKRCIDRIPEWLCDSCRELECLAMDGNQIRHLPSNISNLKQLRIISLVDNQLEVVPESLFNLPSIEIIILSDNRLATPPKVPRDTGRLKFLDLSNNPLPIPPEILAQPKKPHIFWEYLKQIQEDTQPLDEAKVLVVGEGAVGKTSLIRRLARGDYDPHQRKTEGIMVTRWHLPVDNNDIALNIWDFGGQEIMHATHQFFLTRRSVYILVLDVRQNEEQNRVEYWLKLIQGFSDGSPVIVVGNKRESVPLDIDRRGLLVKYPNVVAILEASCAKYIGMDTVKKALSDTIRTLAHVRDPLPRSFFAVKEYLEQLDANYLSFQDYERLCHRCGVSVKEAQELLVGFLHDLGTVLCFRDDPRLRDTNILNPSWVTGGVYRLLNSITAAQLKGLLAWHDIEEILQSDAYPADTHQFIVEMMKKFELCYESDGTFLVPDLLTKEEPDSGSWDDALRFAVKYDVLPLSIIGRLVVRMQHLISRRTVWRTGMVLEMDGNRALVKADREDALLSILVSGPGRGRRGLLTAIRAQLRVIERTIPGLISEELVPVPGHNAWVPYSHLFRLESAGKDTVVPQGLIEEYKIGELLDGVEARGNRFPVSSAVSTESSIPAESSALIERVSSSKLRQTTTDGDAKAWNPYQSITLGVFLLLALLAVITAYVVANKSVGELAAVTIGAAALLIVTVIAFFVLRAAGRIREQTFFEAIKYAISRSGGGRQATEDKLPE